MCACSDYSCCLTSVLLYSNTQHRSSFENEYLVSSRSHVFASVYSSPPPEPTALLAPPRLQQTPHRMRYAVDSRFETTNINGMSAVELTIESVELYVRTHLLHRCWLPELFVQRQWVPCCLQSMVRARGGRAEERAHGEGNSLDLRFCSSMRGAYSICRTPVVEYVLSANKLR